MAVAAAREAVAAGDPASTLRRGERLRSRLLQPVVNATGVLLHTNMGRAPLHPSWLEGRASLGPSNLEIELEDGRRGSRNDRTAALAAMACGAESALIVNNGASAVLLVLAALAAGQPVVVSRGELVEIGGAFRVPDVMAFSGARLVEVGTTNRTRLRDYENGLSGVAGETSPVLMKVHRSNFEMRGFTEETTVGQLSSLGPPVVVDLGSGLLDSNTPWLTGSPPAWLAAEPAARQTLAAGASLVTFSGDKLLGGPQAGIVAGRAELVASCARHPLARALRAGGLVLSVLQETFLAYLRRDGRSIPFWRMATTPVDELRARAAALGVGEVVTCRSAPGGGSLPGLELDSAGVALPGDHLADLRRMAVPVVARVVAGRTVADLRSVRPAEDIVLAEALASVAKRGG